MKLLYWNLKNNLALETLLAECIIENGIDIVVLSEFDGVKLPNLLNALSNQYIEAPSPGAYNDIKILHKKSIPLLVIREQYRYSIVKFYQNNKLFALAGVHLQSNLYGNKSSDRKHTIRQIVDDIVTEEQCDVFSSMVIGDMNASPFDSEMTEKDAFNSVLFKKIIQQKETITYQGKKYRRFYNPIIEYVNEKNEDYGSFYYGSGSNCLYWYCFDQILVRNNLVDQIMDFKYLKQIKHTRLIKGMKPDCKISDHLPLMVEINI